MVILHQNRQARHMVAVAQHLALAHPPLFGAATAFYRQLGATGQVSPEHTAETLRDQEATVQLLHIAGLQ